jgi:hypothetical protein
MAQFLAHGRNLWLKDGSQVTEIYVRLSFYRSFAAIIKTFAATVAHLHLFVLCPTKILPMISFTEAVIHLKRMLMFLLFRG